MAAVPKRALTALCEDLHSETKAKHPSEGAGMSPGSCQHPPAHSLSLCPGVPSCWAALSHTLVPVSIP